LFGLALGACSKPDADALFAAGNQYMKDGLLSEAVLQFKLAIEADPTRADFHSALADTHFRLRDGSAALREATIAADMLPNDVMAQVRAGNLLLLAESFEDAKSRAEKALKLDPTRLEALVLLANSMVGLKNLDSALEEFQEAVALNPEGHSVFASIGAIQLKRGDRAGAEATFRKAVEHAPRSIEARTALAGFLWADGRRGDAEAVLNEALAIDPNSLKANHALGVFYTASGRGAEAEPFFRKIAEVVKDDRAQIALADYYFGQRRYDEAERILTPLASKHEVFEATTLRLAAIEVARKNADRATMLVQSVLERSPRYLPARLFQLRLDFNGGRYDRVIELATSIVSDQPRSQEASEAHFLIGRIHASRDRFDDAARSYEESLRLNPQATAVMMALAQLHLSAERPTKAEAFAQQALRHRPKDPAMRAIVVRARLARNDLEGATEELAALEKDYPTAPAVLDLAAARHLAAGRHDQARAMYAKVLASTPDDLEAIEGLTIIDLAAKQNREALDRIQGALGRMAHSTPLLMVAAKAFAAAGDPARAEALLKEAIEREPARLSAYSLLGQLYVQQNRLSDAGDQFRGLIARSPGSISANTMLGMLLEAQGNLQEAENQYRHTLTIGAEAPIAANNLAWMLLKADRNLDEALQLAQAAAKSLPEDPTINDTLGRLYYKKQLFARAVEHMEIAVARQPMHPGMRFYLGMSYFYNRDFDKARVALGRLVAEHPQYEGVPEARQALAKLGPGPRTGVSR
jgi:putative PEP-CTERM system TPR-repeat lipoprotein